jgi:hypothetical protein
MIAWAPRFRRVERAYLDAVRDGRRGKHEVELAGCSSSLSPAFIPIRYRPELRGGRM